MLLLRLGGVVLAIIEAALLLRLLLPFVRVPPALRGLVPGLVQFTNALIAPFSSLAAPFDLTDVSRLPGGDLGFAKYLDRVDQAVVVALVAWAIIGMVVLFAMRLVIRPGR
jgi:hypothetical protein